MADDLDLHELAPAVDTERAHVAFRRRQRRSRSLRRGVMATAAVSVLVVGTVAVVANLDDDAPLIAGPADTPAGPVTFDVLAITDAADEMGTLRAATSELDFSVLWRHSNARSPRPEINLDERVVVSITIPDDACPPELTAFEREGEAITPVFVEPGGGRCDEPLIPKTYVVALDWDSLAPAFTLRLPADETYGFGEQRLRVGDGEVASDAPRVWVVPDSWVGGEQALFGGTLVYDADLDCFFLDSRAHAVVWPAGTVGTPDGPGVILPGGQMVRAGDSFLGTGGSHDRAEADLFGIVPECVTDSLAVIQFSDVEVNRSPVDEPGEPTCAEIEAFAEAVPDLRPNTDYQSSESPEEQLGQADLVLFGHLTGTVEVSADDRPPAVAFEIEPTAVYKAPTGLDTVDPVGVLAQAPAPLSDDQVAVLTDVAIAGIPVVVFAHALDSYPGFTIGVEGFISGCPRERPIGFVSPRPGWASLQTLDDLVVRLEALRDP